MNRWVCSIVENTAMRHHQGVPPVCPTILVVCGLPPTVSLVAQVSYLLTPTNHRPTAMGSARRPPGTVWVASQTATTSYRHGLSSPPLGRRHVEDDHGNSPSGCPSERATSHGTACLGREGPLAWFWGEGRGGVWAVASPALFTVVVPPRRPAWDLFFFVQPRVQPPFLSLRHCQPKAPSPRNLTRDSNARQ